MYNHPAQGARPQGGKPLILRFDRDLKTQRIIANGGELAAIMGMDRDELGNRVYTYPKEKEVAVAAMEDPVLVTDYYRICRWEPVLRDTVYALYRSLERATDYAGMVLEFTEYRYPGVWGPSIDTLLFCKGLTEEALAGVKSAVEIGCGSGFISKHILRCAPDLQQMVLVDINPHAIECARDHIADPRATFLTGDGIRYLAGRKFDLILCNPPYIPRPGGIEDNPYEGVGLLVHLITQCSDYLHAGGRVITNYSSLCADIAQQAIFGSGHEFQVMERLEVPLKVFNVLNNSAWMEYLKMRSRLQPARKNGYTYWHTISIIQIRP